MSPLMLVSAYHTNLEQSALHVLDLDAGTLRTLRPYPGPIHATDDTLYLLRFLGAQSRLEKYDRGGLCWMRRVGDCLDPHSLIQVGNELAVCSTGTNEIIFLNADGAELRRWSPQPNAEPDSWHLNGLSCHEGRLYATAFGRFTPMRGWVDHIPGSGLLIDVATEQTVLSGLAAPHDARRVDDGWLVNASQQGRLMLYPDSGAPRVIVEVDGFPRGLAVLPDHYVLGVSRPRQPGGPQGCAEVLLIDRRTYQVLRRYPVPQPEIGHVSVGPGPEVLDVMRREQAMALPCLMPQRQIITDENRAGCVRVFGSFRMKTRAPEVHEVTVQVSNASRATWASENDYPIHVSYQVVNAAGGVLLADGARTRLPLPVTPGRSLTFPIYMDLTICHHLPAAAAVRITLLQENVAWWEASERWSPALVPLPDHLITPGEATMGWRSRWKQMPLPGRRPERTMA